MNKAIDIIEKKNKEIANLRAEIKRKDEALKSIYEISNKGISTYEIGMIQSIIEQALSTEEDSDD